MRQPPLLFYQGKFKLLYAQINKLTQFFIIWLWRAILEYQEEV